MFFKTTCQKAMTTQKLSLDNFKFVKCRGCGTIWRDAAALNRKYGHLEPSFACRKAYGGGQASTANSGLFT